LGYHVNCGFSDRETKCFLIYGIDFLAVSFEPAEVLTVRTIERDDIDANITDQDLLYESQNVVNRAF